MVVAAALVQAEALVIRAMLAQTVMLVTPVPMVVALRRVLRVAPEMLVRTEQQETQVLTVRALRLVLRVAPEMLVQMVMLAQARQTATSAIPVTRVTRQLLAT